MAGKTDTKRPARLESGVGGGQKTLGFYFQNGKMKKRFEIDILVVLF